MPNDSRKTPGDPKGGPPSPNLFPTREDIARRQAATGIARPPSPDEIVLRLKRHLPQTPELGEGVRALLAHHLQEVLEASAPWMRGLIQAERRPRFDHRSLSQTARNTFNQALQAAETPGAPWKVAPPA
jgi:hypothetical protein